MKTIQLKISDKVYDKFLWLLSKFSKEEIEIINGDENFINTKNYLQNELSEIDADKASFVSEEELEYRLNKIVQFFMKIIFKDSFVIKLENQIKFLSYTSSFCFI